MAVAFQLVGIFVYEDNENPLNIPFWLFMAFWATCFNKSWSRTEKMLSFLFGTYFGASNSRESIRKEFRGCYKIDQNSNGQIIVYNKISTFARIVLVKN